MQVQVHMTIDGPVVLDIVQHFIERWNMIKGRKVSNYITQSYFVTDSSAPIILV
jgi:phosphatidylserine/phosphatidylglycerophosphate/cardiolipin synthase-like enzyme